MVDLGITLTVNLPNADGFSPVTDYEVKTSGLEQGGERIEPTHPTFPTRTYTDYQLAGTYQNPYYKPPTVGQIWPRGDLDAV